jgi:hypothetical protein
MEVILPFNVVNKCKFDDLILSYEEFPQHPSQAQKNEIHTNLNFSNTI